MARCRLTERIKFQSLVESQNDNGFNEENWIDYYECWSKYRSIKGSEFIAAKQTGSENIVTFLVRYCNKTKALLDSRATKIYKIIFRGRTYNIEYASDYEDLHEYIDIKCSVID